MSILKETFRIPGPVMTELQLTAIYEKANEGGYIGYITEFPGANTQGETIEETRENLMETVSLLLQVTNSPQ